MSYKIDWQSNNVEGVPGKAAIILSNKTLDTSSTSLTLTGKGINNYGEIQQENFLKLMENFASSIPPANPTIGQMWYNTAETILYMRVDPNIAGSQHPLYFPQSPAAWLQIWPAVGGPNSYAGLNEYNTLAIEINKIIGAVSMQGTDPDPAFNEWGWGQTDLVPVYTNINTLAAGFSSSVYPPVFDNNAWVILLSRVRKALRHVGIPETQVSPVGFINDNRPVGPVGNALANTYNNYPAVGTLANYTAGWNQNGMATIQMLYANTLNTITSLTNTRFTAAPVSTEMTTLGTTTRASAWTSSISQAVTLTFASHNAARSFFNSGGSLVFNFALNSPGADLLSTRWSSFLASQDNLTFDFKGVHLNGVYFNGPSLSLGFYDLSTTPMLIYEVKRNYDGGVYSAIFDGGLRLYAHKVYNGDGTCTINFSIVLVEAPFPGESVTGTLVLGQVAKKANSININSSALYYPTWTGSAITDVVPAPPTGIFEQ